jgi:hypothetical protein
MFRGIGEGGDCFHLLVNIFKVVNNIGVPVFTGEELALLVTTYFGRSGILVNAIK